MEEIESLYKTDNPLGFKLSHSSIALYQGCNRRFYHYKIAKTPVDPDFVDDQKALKIGSVFHSMVEYCEHDYEKYEPFMFQKALSENEVTDKAIAGMAHGLCKKYLELHKKSGLKVVKCELPVTDENVIGFIDAVMANDEGQWWIVDLKTAAAFSKGLITKLANDPQLNLYSAYAYQVAEALDLELSKFAGIRYRVTVKPKNRFGKNDDIESYAEKIYYNTESYDLEVSKDLLNPEFARARVMHFFQEIIKGKMKGEGHFLQNFGYCENYFKPCPYWSRCHSGTYTSEPKMTVYNSESMVDLNKNIIDEDLEFLSQ